MNNTVQNLRIRGYESMYRAVVLAYLYSFYLAINGTNGIFVDLFV
jgi:hypothetical protein